LFRNRRRTDWCGGHATGSSAQAPSSNSAILRARSTLQDIGTESITPAQLVALKELAGSCGPLFMRIAMKYRGMGLDRMRRAEQDVRGYIPEEYTFLKRPVIGRRVFVGSAPKAVKAMPEAAKGPWADGGRDGTALRPGYRPGAGSFSLRHRSNWA